MCKFSFIFRRIIGQGSILLSSPTTCLFTPLPLTSGRVLSMSFRPLEVVRSCSFRVGNYSLISHSHVSCKIYHLKPFGIRNFQINFIASTQIEVHLKRPSKSLHKCHPEKSRFKLSSSRDQMTLIIQEFYKIHLVIHTSPLQSLQG